MNQNMIYSTLNYRKNIFLYREKLCQDLNLKKNLYNIYNGRSRYNYSKRSNGFLSRYTQSYGQSYGSCSQSRNNSRSSSRKNSIYDKSTSNQKLKNDSSKISSYHTCNTINNSKFQRHFKNFDLSLSLKQSKEKVRAQKEQEVKRDNFLFRNRINRVSSPYSKKRLFEDFNKKKSFYYISRGLKSNNFLEERKQKILDRLPNIYFPRYKKSNNKY